MSETMDNYRGLPIPNLNDYITLTYMEPDVHEASPVSEQELARYLDESRPDILEVIFDDAEHWFASEKTRLAKLNRIDRSRDKSKEPLLYEYVSGIHNGYNFFFTLMVNLKFMRSDYSSIWHFILDSEKTRALPILGPLELKRIIEVRNGQGLVEKIPGNNYIDNSEEFSYYDAMNYSDTFSRFSQLLQNTIEQDEARRAANSRILRTPRRQNSYRDGFEHGAHNALEMYLQVEETNTLSRMMDDLNTLYDHFEDTPPFSL